MEGMIDWIISFRKWEMLQMMSMEYTVPSIILGFPLILLPIDLIFIISSYYFYSYSRAKRSPYRNNRRNEPFPGRSSRGYWMDCSPRWVRASRLIWCCRMPAEAASKSWWILLYIIRCRTSSCFFHLIGRLILLQKYDKILRLQNKRRENII